MARIDYSAVLKSLLNQHRKAGSSISTADLFALPELGGASINTKLKHLKVFLSTATEYIGTVQGVLPSVEAIVGLAEQELGTPVSELNVVAANEVCRHIVLRTAAPVVEEFIRTGLEEHIGAGTVTVPLAGLTDFLVNDFATFMKGSGNSLVSIAGSINEQLLVACLAQKGMEAGKDFTRTGQESEGDIKVHSKAASKVNLNVEIKSYHARERLLRGLRDVERPKVGVGYFKDGSEFNPSRTRQLLQTNTAAIYMPNATLATLSAESRVRTSQEIIAYDSAFYRPIERFASDMLHFVSTGELPTLKPGP